MAAKKQTMKQTAKADQAPTHIIQNCTFTGNSAANEHTRAAVVALADACKQNAMAIAAAADALKGGVGMQTGVSIGGFA